jgi:hypothetical protein
MRRFIHFIISFILFCLYSPFSAWAYMLQYNPAYLAQWGIDIHQFKIVEFSGNDRVLLAIERVNRLSLRAKGYVWVLRIIHVEPTNDAITNVRSVLLPISDIQNMAISDDGKTAIIVAQYGTKILQVNVEKGTFKTIFSHEVGKPGFRSDKRLCWYHNGKFYTEGYFYDPQGYWISNDIVSLDLSHPNSIQLFQKKWDIDETQKSIGIPQVGIFVSGHEGFWGIRSSSGSNADEIALYHIENGKAQLLDTAQSYGGWAATDHRILYAALRKDGSHDVIIKDTASGKSWNLASGSTPYLYPYLSRDGKVAVVATMDFKNGTISFFYAKEENNFQLQPLTDLQNLPLGIFRLSPDGKRYAFENRDGLIIGNIP